MMRVKSDRKFLGRQADRTKLHAVSVLLRTRGRNSSIQRFQMRCLKIRFFAR